MASEPSEWARGYMRILEDEDSCAECGDFEGDGEACECEDTCGRFLRRCAIADVAKAEGDAAGYERGLREWEEDEMVAWVEARYDPKGCVDAAVLLAYNRGKEDGYKLTTCYGGCDPAAMEMEAFKRGKAEGVREEREACAKKAGEYADAWANHNHGWCAGVIAKAIRARGEPQADGKGGG